MMTRFSHPIRAFIIVILLFYLLLDRIDNGEEAIAIILGMLIGIWIFIGMIELVLTIKPKSKNSN